MPQSLRQKQDASDPAHNPVAHPLRELERRAGSASLVYQRPRPHDWQVTMFRDHPDARHAVYLTGYGATLEDAAQEVLDDPMSNLTGVA